MRSGSDEASHGTEAEHSRSVAIASGEAKDDRVHWVSVMNRTS